MMHCRWSTLWMLSSAAVVIHGSSAAALAQGIVGSGPTLLTLAQSSANAGELVQPVHRVTLALREVALPAALDTVAARAGVTAIYSRDIVPANRYVSVQGADLPAATAFALVLRGTGFEARLLTSGQFIIERSPSDRGRHVMVGNIAGKVIDARTKLPVRGATITIDDATRGVQTNADGTFRITNVGVGAHHLTIRMLGYVRQTQTTSVTDGQTASIEVPLVPSTNALDQVIVTGMVAATAQKAVPNAMTVITAKDIEQRGITQIQQLFRGDVPGLFAQNLGANSPLDSVAMFSRGSSVMTSARYYVNATQQSGDPTMIMAGQIKTYVDGVELANPGYLSQIDPRSIERIEILTGPQASTIYGSNALNGVMQIFTKRGNTPRPQVTAALLSGVVQNDFRSSLTPQHDYSAQVNGSDTRWSYNAGGSWTYMGPWTPAKQTSTVSGFGGVRMTMGTFATDANVRLALTENHSRGDSNQLYADMVETGFSYPSANNGRTAPTTSRLNGTTMGLTLTYTPLSWWSHELGVGHDVSTQQTLVTQARYSYGPSDSLLTFNQFDRSRLSLHYTNTIKLALSENTQTVLTTGIDGWQSMYTKLWGQPTTLTGTLTGTNFIGRQPDHNTGAFFQGQFGLRDALFLTYGIRAEWNPGFGADATPNYAPRYGVAYTYDVTTPLGTVTTKVRASYGRSTRPPTVGEKSEDICDASCSASQIYGVFADQLANPLLGPEHQQGGEGGLELYFGNRASLVVTRYNQTVDGLIGIVPVDTARPLDPTYPYVQYIFKYLNIGAIRNQGWEMQGNATIGALTAKGTYSWTKSRFLGITPEYRATCGTGYCDAKAPGYSFGGFPEHTWAVGLIYAQPLTSVSLNFNGTGQSYVNTDLFKYMNQYPRLTANRAIITIPSLYRATAAGYVMADMNATRRVSSRIEGVVQIQNLGNAYHNDYNVGYATMGRQTKAGLRIRW